MKTCGKFQLMKIKCWLKIHIKEWAPPFWVGCIGGIVFICILWICELYEEIILWSHKNYQLIQHISTICMYRVALNCSFDMVHEGWNILWVKFCLLWSTINNYFNYKETGDWRENTMLYEETIQLFRICIFQ